MSSHIQSMVGSRVWVTISLPSTTRRYEGVLEVFVPAYTLPCPPDNASEDLKRQLQQMQSPAKFDRIIVRDKKGNYLTFHLDHGSVPGTGKLQLGPVETYDLMARDDAKKQLAAMERLEKKRAQTIETERRKLNKASFLSLHGNSSKAKRQFRMLIVDQYPFLGIALSLLVENEPDLIVCGTTSIADALQMFESEKPDLVVTCIYLRDRHAIELIERIKARDAKVKILVCSVFAEEFHHLYRCFRAGASGFVHRDDMYIHSVSAIRTILSGRVYLTTDLAEDMLAHTVEHGAMR